MPKTYVPCGTNQYYEDPIGSLGYTNIGSACDWTGIRRDCKASAVQGQCPITTTVVLPPTTQPIAPGTVITVEHPIVGGSTAGVVSTDGQTVIIPPTDATAEQAPAGSIPGSVVDGGVVTDTGLLVPTAATGTMTVKSERLLGLFSGLVIFMAILSFLYFVGFFPLIYSIFTREFKSMESGGMKFLKALGNTLFALFLTPWFAWVNLKQN